MHRGYFQLLSTYEDGRVEFTSVNIHDLISKQRRAVKKILGQVVQALKENEMAHREKFKDRQIAQHFLNNRLLPWKDSNGQPSESER